VQFVNVLLSVIGRVQTVRYPEMPLEGGHPKPIAHARTWFNGQAHEHCPLFNRSDIRPGQFWQGPAVIAGEDSTIVVPPDWKGQCDTFGNLILTYAGDTA